MLTGLLLPERPLTVWAASLAAEGRVGVDGASSPRGSCRKGVTRAWWDTGSWECLGFLPYLTNGAGLWVPASASDGPVVLCSQCLSPPPAAQRFSRQAHPWIR